MSQPQPGINDDAPLDIYREEMMSEIFAHLVIQNTNMALMLLGLVPHPQSGERMCDPESAVMFLDQLEMLEAKTTGNLTPEEQQLLQQSRTRLHQAFEQVAENPPEPEAVKPAAGSAAPVPAAPTVESGEAESNKRYSKKF